MQWKTSRFMYLPIAPDALALTHKFFGVYDTKDTRIPNSICEPCVREIRADHSPGKHDPEQILQRYIAARRTRCKNGECPLCLVYAERSRPPLRKIGRRTQTALQQAKPVPVEAEEKAARPFVISKHAFLEARAKTGLPASALLEFATALEQATAAEGKPIQFESGLRDATTEQNKMFEEYVSAENVKLGVGEGAAVLIDDIPGFTDTVLKADGRTRADVALVRVSLDDGQRTLKATVSFIYHGSAALTERKECGQGMAPKLLGDSGVRKTYLLAEIMTSAL